MDENLSLTHTMWTAYYQRDWTALEDAMDAVATRLIQLEALNQIEVF